VKNESLIHLIIDPIVSMIHEQIILKKMCAVEISLSI